MEPHHGNTLKPQQPRLFSQEEEDGFSRRESIGSSEQRPSAVSFSGDAAQMMVAESGPPSGSERNSFQSIVMFRQPGVRRSVVLEDTPGHFSRAQDETNVGSAQENEGREDIRVSEPDTPNVFNGSERSSELFEDCRQVSVEQVSNEAPPVKIHSLKDLFKVLNIEMGEDSTFSFQGTSYQCDFHGEDKHNIQFPNLSAFFAPQDLANNQFAQHMPSFGNLREHMRVPNSNNNNNHQYQGYSGEAFSASKHQTSLPNLDKLLLSNEPSPTSVANRQFHNAQFGVPSFSRAVSEQHTLPHPKVDKEVQVELILPSDINNLVDSHPNILPPPEEKKVQAEEKPKKEVKGDDYFAKVQEQIALELDEFDLPDPSSFGKGRKKKKMIQEAKSQIFTQQPLTTQKAGSTFARNRPVAHLATEKQVSQHVPSFDFNDLQNSAGTSLQRTQSVREPASFRQHSKVLPDQLQLQAMTSKMHELQVQIQKLEKEASSKYIGGATNRLSEANLHLVFLFASPLVIRKPTPNANGEQFKDQYRQQALLEFKKEFKGIKESLKETGLHIKVRSLQATIENLSLILAQNPLALHFTGHGFETKQGGKISNSLLLEYEDGEGEEVSEQQLTTIIRKTNADLEFVFVASCYSEFAGKAFLKAGARHVICVKSGNQIADVAVILFSKTFYHSAFSQSMTICQSFELARSLVQSRYGPVEASKFSILTKKDFEDGQTSNLGMPDIHDDEEFQVQLEPQHQCKVFGPFNKGEVESLDTEVKLKEMPQSVEDFIGRQVEMFEVVHNVLNHRFVNIIGLPGIGKTALAKNAINYMADRKLFKQGIVFFSLKGYRSCDVFIKKLVSNIVAANFTEVDAQDDDAEKLFRMVIGYLHKAEEPLLVVFDNAEELLYHDRKGFREMITELITSCRCLKILLTSRITVGVLQDITEKIVVLQELTPTQSVDLFFSRARHVDEEEKRELLNFKPDSFLLAGDANNINQNEVITNLSKHHLFKILSGNPHAIILAAPLLLAQKRRLKDLYELLNSEKLLEVLKVDGVTDSTVASLCLSLEASIIVLEKEDQFTLHFFYLVGLLPGGVFKDECAHIWKMGGKDPGYQYHIDKLMTLSLLQVKEQAGDEKESKLMLPPFINNYAEQTIEPALKLKFQQILCEYYVRILRDMYRVDFRHWAAAKNNESGDSPNDATPRRQQLENAFVQELRKRLIRHETNIWACVYRMVKSEKPIQIDHIEIEDNKANLKKRSRRHSVMTPREKEHGALRVRKAPKTQSAFETDDFSSLDENLAQTSASVGGFIHSQSEKSKRDIMLGEMGPMKSYFMPPSQVIEEEMDNKSDISDNVSALKKDPPEPSEGSLFKHLVNKDNSSDEMSSHSSHDKEDRHDQVATPITPGNTSWLKNLNLAKAKASSRKGSDQSPIQPTEEAQSSPQFDTMLSQRLFTPIQKMIQDQIKSIARHSIVKFFQRDSLRASVTQLPEEDGGLNEGSGKVESDDDMYLPQKCFSQQEVQSIGLGATASTPDTNLRGVAHLSEAEKLIVYYGMNLYLLKDYESALKLIRMYAVEIQGSQLFQANIQRILGLIHLRKVEIKEAMAAFKSAESLYEKCRCYYGGALTKFSIGFMYRSNYSELLESSSESQKSQQEVVISAQRNLQQALRLFQQLSHIMGQARCHEHLGFIQKKLGNEIQAKDHQKSSCELSAQFGKYILKYKKSCPHVQRSSGQDFSLMCEIVTDSQLRNLFPDINASTSAPAGSLRALLAAKREQSSRSHFSEDKDQKDKLFLSHQVSAPPLNFQAIDQNSTLTPDRLASPFTIGSSNLQPTDSQLFSEKEGETSALANDTFFLQEDKPKTTSPLKVPLLNLNVALGNMSAPLKNDSGALVSISVEEEEDTPKACDAHEGEILKPQDSISEKTESTAAQPKRVIVLKRPSLSAMSSPKQKPEEKKGHKSAISSPSNRPPTSKVNIKSKAPFIVKKACVKLSSATAQLFQLDGLPKVPVSVTPTKLVKISSKSFLEQSVEDSGAPFIQSFFPHPAEEIETLLKSKTSANESQFQS